MAITVLAPMFLAMSAGRHVKVQQQQPHVQTLERKGTVSSSRDSEENKSQVNILFVCLFLIILALLIMWTASAAWAVPHHRNSPSSPCWMYVYALLDITVIQVNSGQWWGQFSGVRLHKDDHVTNPQGGSLNSPSWETNWSEGQAKTPWENKRIWCSEPS